MAAENPDGRFVFLASGLPPGGSILAPALHGLVCKALRPSTLEARSIGLEGCLEGKKPVPAAHWLGAAVRDIEENVERR